VRFLLVLEKTGGKEEYLGGETLRIGVKTLSIVVETRNASLGGVLVDWEPLSAYGANSSESEGKRTVLVSAKKNQIGSIELIRIAMVLTKRGVNTDSRSPD